MTDLEAAEQRARDAQEALVAERRLLARARERLAFLRRNVAHQVDVGGDVDAAAAASEAARLEVLACEEAVDMAQAVAALRDEELRIARQAAQSAQLASPGPQRT